MMGWLYWWETEKREDCMAAVPEVVLPVASEVATHPVRPGLQEVQERDGEC